MRHEELTMKKNDKQGCFLFGISPKFYIGCVWGKKVPTDHL